MTATPAGPQAAGSSRFSLGGQVSDLGYAAGWRVVRAMPELVARNAFDAGAILASRNGGPEQLRKNLARVLGVPPARVPGGLIRASLASYARYWREAFRLPSMDKEKLRAHIEPCLLGSEHIRTALEAGRGGGHRAHRALDGGCAGLGDARQDGDVGNGDGWHRLGTQPRYPVRPLRQLHPNRCID